MSKISHAFITGPKKYDHITPVLEALNWLSVEKKICYEVAVLLPPPI